MSAVTAQPPNGSFLDGNQSTYDRNHGKPINLEYQSLSVAPPKNARDRSASFEDQSEEEEVSPGQETGRLGKSVEIGGLLETTAKLASVNESKPKPVASKNGKPTSLRRPLQRAKTEQDLSEALNRHPSDEPRQQNWEYRHGWEEQLTSEEYLRSLSSKYFMHYTDKRHESAGRPRQKGHPRPPRDWSLRDKTKTVSAALMLCLNLGVDPPDIVKPNPCATSECWIDPTMQTMSNPKILEAIGKKLQEQFETLSIKTRYKQHLDPSSEEIRRHTAALRKSAKDERVLFYYNGHGVPLPTASGEIWVFNRDYTQYIPIALYDLQTWIAGPTLCIFDCSHAGNIIKKYEEYVKRHERENAEVRAKDPDANLQNYGNNIHMAACGPKEQLPTNPDLPADLFTCCLTTPIDICLRFHVLTSPMHHAVSFEDLQKVPGKLTERRSPRGELNWILTAVTDTIAWNALPRELFRQLFRQDLMVAALFRNYLVAQRIMHAYGCNTATVPTLPPTHDHRLWESWDLAVEVVISQLPAILESGRGGEPYEYQSSNFFIEQLTAFETYLQQEAPQKALPKQLPVVLQILLSQTHRLKALVLLSKFLDMGPWAVNLSLTIGIFPYIVKLLQSPAVELKPIMIFIWARIIAVAPHEAQGDLLRESGFQYFCILLTPAFTMPIGNLAEHKAMAAFVITMFCRNFPQGQRVCLASGVMESCLEHISHSDNDLLRIWSCLCLSILWKEYSEAKWFGIRHRAHLRLCPLAVHPIPEIRAAVIHALTNFIGIPDLTEPVVREEETVASAVMLMTLDGSAMVRRELLVFYSVFVKRYCKRFVVIAYENLVEEQSSLREACKEPDDSRAITGSLAVRSIHGNQLDVSENTIYATIWYQLLAMSVDAHPEISQNAKVLLDFVYVSLLKSPLASIAQNIIDEILDLVSLKETSSKSATIKQTPTAQTSTPKSSSPPKPYFAIPRSETYLSLGIKRTASVAVALKSFLGTVGLQESEASKENIARTPRSHTSRTARSTVPPDWTTSSSHEELSRPLPHLQDITLPRPRDFTPSGSGQMKIPFGSTFLEYATEYFLEPQMKNQEAEDLGSDLYNQRLWKRLRNEKILSATQPLKAEAGSKSWDVGAGSIDNVETPLCLTFHQYEDQIAVADDRDGIAIWNWQDKKRLAKFSNNNPRGTRINDMHFMNEDDQALLVAGSSDGVIKIYRQYDSPESPELITSYKALTELIPSTKNAGLVFDWQQGQGKMLCAGDVRVIRVWNVATELCINDIPTHSGSCITSLTSDRVAGNIFAAGFGDGAVRVFDQRLRPQDAMVCCWREQKQWITDVCMQRGGIRELVSGSRNGEVRLWDIRLASSVGSLDASASRTMNRSSKASGNGEVMRAMALHEHAPVLATGFDHQSISFFNTDGSMLSTTSLHSPFTSHARSSPVASIAFHPHRMLFATGCVGSGTVSFWTCGHGPGFAG